MATKNTLDRHAFLKVCGATCLTVTALPVLTGSCKSIYYAQTPVLRNQVIEVSKKEFEMVNKKGVITLRSYILVELKGQTFPIYLHRSDDRYTAVLMKCAHQGNELNAHDGYLTCPAHGSEYDAEGRVTEGPAEKNLQSYPVTTDEKIIHINIV